MSGNSSNAKDNIPPGRQLIQEGTVSMLYPKDVVFYNPVQVQNRDLSLFMITLYSERRIQRAATRAYKKKLNKEYKAKGEKLHDNSEIKAKMETFDKEYKLTNEYATNIKGVRILDALAASGLRSLRYHKEIPSSFVHSVTINDLDPAAVDLAKENISYNNLSHALVECDEESTKGGICVQIVVFSTGIKK